MRQSTAVIAGGVSLSVLTVLGAGLIAWSVVRTSVESARGDLQTVARMVEDQSSRTFESGAIALSAIADTVAAQHSEGDPVHMGPQLFQTLLGLPAMRSIAVLDASGRVLASTVDGEVDQVIRLGALGAGSATAGVPAIGPPVSGRGLLDLNGGTDTPSGVSFIPMTLRLYLPGGQVLYVVGLINPPYLVAYQQRILEDVNSPASSALMSYGGEVLASSGDSSFGELHPVTSLIEHLRERQQQSYIAPAGQAAGEDTRMLVAYRGSRLFPIVAVVRQPYASVVFEGLGVMRWLGPAAIAVVAAILVLTALAARAMRIREQQRFALEQAYERIADGERELQSLVESVQELIFRTDANGVLEFANARWSSIGGRQEPLGRHLCDLVMPADRQDAIGLFDDPASDEVRRAQLSVQDGEGGHHLLAFALVPLMRNGVRCGYAGSAMDITKRVAAERRVEAQVRFLNLLQEVAPMPICMTDAQGRFLNVNRAWEDFMGRAREDVIGRHNKDFLPPGEAAAYDAHSERLLREGGQAHYEEIIERADGTQRNVQVSKVMVPHDDGTPFGLLSVKLDVTAFRHAQAAAEDASRTKSEFVANISHELRTPLQSILGFSELGFTRGSATPKLAAMFDEIHASGIRMLELVNNLLDISKIESAVGTFNFATMDLRRCVTNIATELEPLLDRKHQRLDLHVAPRPLMANIDEIRFQQVIRNVVANAIKFSPEGSRITFSAGHVFSADAGSDIVLSVADQGPGIPEGERELIFQPFMQSSLTRQGAGGTGLGLAICKKILDAHGGSIAASNAEGGGAVFEVHLKCARSEKA